LPVDIQWVEGEATPVGGVLLQLRGTLDAAAAAALLRTVTPALRGGRSVTLDLAEVISADTAGVAALAESLLTARRLGVELRAIGTSGQVRAALQRTPLVAASTPPATKSFLERLGETMVAVWRGTIDFMQLLADTAYWALIAPFQRRFAPPGATSTQAIRIGVDALPIVALIALLLGLVMAFNAAYQLRAFGANIFVANLVGIAMVRELGPLMSAIIVAGRSGSAIAAELGTMTVGEEIDALRTMGINELRFLVVPRVYAITMTQPALTMFANIVGILGGFLIGVLYLDLSARAYIDQTLSSLSLDDLLTGLSKSLVFAWIIALVGCHCGLRITGGAEGVGRATTASVVASIFAIIVADSVFTTLTTVLG
jgi:phospholipid/cholesterol/gamma-HCH transport system permease protein